MNNLALNEYVKIQQNFPKNLNEMPQKISTADYIHCPQELSYHYVSKHIDIIADS